MYSDRNTRSDGKGNTDHGTRAGRTRICGGGARLNYSDWPDLWMWRAGGGVCAGHGAAAGRDAEGQGPHGEISNKLITGAD